MSGEIDLLLKDMPLKASGDRHRGPYDPSRDRKRIFGVIALLLVGLLFWIVVALLFIGFLIWLLVTSIGSFLIG
jgi:hypothetical protein